MTPVVYMTDHAHSQVVGKAFAEGCGAEVVHARHYDPNDERIPVMFGILRGTGDLVKDRWARNLPFLYIDHGYFKPGHYEGYYRVCKSDLQAQYVHETSPERFEALKIKLEPRKIGRAAAIANPSAYVLSFFEAPPPDVWVGDAVQSYTSGWNLFTVNSHNSEERSIFKKVCSLATLQSNLSIEAIRRGIAVKFVEPRRSIRPITHPAKSDWTDRRDLFHSLANSQFTLDEMRRGVAWEKLNAG